MLRDKISQIEYDMMETYREYNVGYNSDRVKPMKDILNIWEQEKSYYLNKLFNDELIISKDINIEKDDSILGDEIQEKLMNHPFMNEFRTFIYFYQNDIMDAIVSSSEDHFSDRTYKCSIIRHTLINEHSLLSNRYDGPEITFAYKEKGRNNFTKYKMNSGTKVMKAVSKIISIFCKDNYSKKIELQDEFENFRIIHSQIFNEKTTKGELCLSIHPMDYMTMSDNECGWRSCMAWRDSGEYRLGTVEMMNSSMVVVAYLKSSVDMSVGRAYSWNSKRWRELFIINQDTIIGVKGYPYWSLSLEEEVLLFLKELAYKNLGWEYHDSIYTIDCKDRDCKVIDHPNITFTFETEYMYCDFYSKHHLLLSKNIDINADNDYYAYFCYSGPAQCMGCGEVAEFDGESFLLCCSCDESWVCDECESHMFSTDEQYDVDGHTLCQFCYDNLPVCDNCGEHHIQSSLEKVYVMINDENDLTTINFSLDIDCLESGNLFDYSDLKTVTINYRYFSDTLCYVHYNDLTEKGKREFEFKLTDLGETMETYEGPFYIYN